MLAMAWYDSEGKGRWTVPQGIAASFDRALQCNGALLQVEVCHWKYSYNDVKVDMDWRNQVSGIRIDVDSAYWEKTVKLLYIIENQLSTFSPLYWRNMETGKVYDDLCPESVCDALAYNEDEYGDFWKEVEHLL